MSEKKYWLTPPKLLADLEKRYGPFDFDPCPYPLPEGFDGLSEPWGRRNYVNPPFRPTDVQNTKIKRPGPTAFVHKAIYEQKMGKSSVLVLPVQSYVAHLSAAGAQIEPLGRVRWLEVDTKEPYPQPTTICAFILKGKV